MKFIDKEIFIGGLEKDTEEFINYTMEYFQKLDENILNAPSDSGGWSITQCLAHVNTYGHYYLPKLKTEIGKQAQKSYASKYKPSWLAAFLIRLMDTQTSKMKFRAVSRHQPSEFLQACQVINEFIEQQKEMLNILRSARHADLYHSRISLSVASWIKLSSGEIMQFMVVHSQRHMIQAKRNMPDSF